MILYSNLDFMTLSGSGPCEFKYSFFFFFGKYSYTVFIISVFVSV